MNIMYSWQAVIFNLLHTFKLVASVEFDVIFFFLYESVCFYFFS